MSTRLQEYMFIFVWHLLWSYAASACNAGRHSIAMAVQCSCTLYDSVYVIQRRWTAHMYVLNCYHEGW